MPIIFSNSLANLIVISGSILQPVLDGTLYKIIGNVDDLANKEK